MPRIRAPWAAVAAGAALMLAVPRAGRAQDAAAVNPRTIHVKVDNDRVRVFEAALAPGEKEQMHSHPSSVVYVIAGGKVRNHGADGTVSEAVLHDGDVLYRDPITHWAENIGTTTVRLIVLELKDPR